MNTLIVNKKQLESMPYGKTIVKWTKTKGEIEGKLLELEEKGLLKKNGWVKEGDAETLYLELEILISDTENRRVTLKFEPTLIYVDLRNRGKPMLNRDVTWRLFWWHFKARLEAVLYGLTTVEEMFMSNIVRQLADGREVTFGDALKVILLEGRLDNVLEDKRDRVQVTQV